MTFPEIVITLPDEDPVSIPVTIPQRPLDSLLSGHYRVPGGVYSSPGTPDSSIGSPVSPERSVSVNLDTNSTDHDDLNILDQDLDPDNQERLLQIIGDLEQTTFENTRVQDGLGLIQSDGCHQSQQQEQHDLQTLDFSCISDLLSADLSTVSANDITELDIVTQNDRVYHQLQNMKQAPNYDKNDKKGREWQEIPDQQTDRHT